MLLLAFILNFDFYVKEAKSQSIFLISSNLEKLNKITARQLLLIVYSKKDDEH